MKPLFIITARRLFPYDEIKRSQTCGDIFAHSSMHISFNFERFFRLLCRILFFHLPQWLSIGLRSGNWLGHWRTSIFLSLNLSPVKSSVCLGSCSCWNVHLSFFNNRFALGMRLFSDIWRYVAPIHFPINDVQCTSPNHYTTTSVLRSWYDILIRCHFHPPNMISSDQMSFPILISFLQMFF